MREDIFPQGCQHSLFKCVIFFPVDILPAFTKCVFRQYFFCGNFPTSFAITPAFTDIPELGNDAFGPALVNPGRSLG